MPRPKPNQTIVSEALALTAAGLSSRDIGEKLGVSEGTVRRWAKVALAQTRVSAAVAARAGREWTVDQIAVSAGVLPDEVRLWVREKADQALARARARLARS